MRTTKSIAVVFSILGLLFFITGCKWKDRNNKNSKDKVYKAAYISKKNLAGLKIGYCTPSLKAPYYMALSKSIQTNAEGLGMKFISADGQDDIAKQITAVEDLISSGVSVLVLNPLDPVALVPSVNTAIKAGIPVFIIDSNIDKSAHYTSYIQSDNEGNGVLLGEWMMKKLGNRKPEIAIISGTQGSPVGKLRRMGFIKGFTDTQLTTNGNSELNIVAQGWGSWTNNGGLKAMEDILVAHPTINLLFAENDAMAIGALKAIKETGKEGKIIIASVDGQKEALELINSEKIGATGQNSPALIAEQLMETVVKYLNDEKNISKSIFTPAIIITKENVIQYYNPKSLF